MSVPWVDFSQSAWREQAACRGTNPDVFFPERGESSKAAKAICAACPVTGECLDYALTHAIHDGIWGGLSERARKRLRRSGTEVTVTCDACGQPFVHVVRPTRRPTCCEDCVTERDRQRKRRYDVEYRVAVPGSSPRMSLAAGHGTISKYQSGCRCGACRKASRVQRAKFARTS